MPLAGGDVRRRGVCRALAATLVAGSSGCLLFTGRRGDSSDGCGVADHPVVDVTVAVEGVTDADVGWQTDCRVTVAIRNGNDRLDLTLAALVATGAENERYGYAALRDFGWGDVPANRRTPVETCAGEVPEATITARHTLTTTSLPEWFGVRFHPENVGELRVEFSRYRGSSPADGPTADDYEAVPAADAPFDPRIEQTNAP